MSETETKARIPLPPGEATWRALDELIEKRAETSVQANLEEMRLKASEKRRLENRQETNRRLWATHYWRMASAHTKIAGEYLERAGRLEEESTNGRH